MNDRELLDTLQSVWENLTWDRDIQTYRNMLVLLDDMTYFLRSDLQIEYELPEIEIQKGAFEF